MFWLRNEKNIFLVPTDDTLQEDQSCLTICHHFLAYCEDWTGLFPVILLRLALFLDGLNEPRSTCDFQQCGILTSVDSDESLQPPFKLRNSN